MLEIREVESIDQLTELKQQYIQQTTAPLDGMWLLGFVPMATHFGFYQQDTLIGYCCINSDGYLLQFHIDSDFKVTSSDTFKRIFDKKHSPVESIKGAFVSTAEPHYLSLCLDTFTDFQVNALMYQRDNKAQVPPETPLPMSVATSDQLMDFVEFAKMAIGAPDEWVTGYFASLIERQELFGYWQSDKLLASGECRLREQYQSECADLGMIVAPSERGKGLGTKVVQYVLGVAEAKGLKPICSTEKGNIGAQKALARAGLFAGNRIIRFDL